MLDKGWAFYNGEISNEEKKQENIEDWKQVTVPHDWAISGDFDKMIDAREIQVIEDGEHDPKLRTGRTGGLPHIGIGWYQRSLNIKQACKNKRVHLEFDGAMSHAKIYVNGEYVGECTEAKRHQQ